MILRFCFSVSSIAIATSLAQGQMVPPAQGQTLWDYHTGFMTEPGVSEFSEEEGSALSLHNKMMMQWAPRLFPSGDLHGITEAVRQQMTRMLTHTRSGGGIVSNWSPLGPMDMPNYQNTGIPNSRNGTGQIHVITFDPGYGTGNSTVYCGSSYGGMFKSTNGGDSWTSMTDHAFPFTPVSDIVVLDQDPQTLIVGTGGADGFRYSSGVWRSTNGGVDWEHISVGFLSEATMFVNVYNVEVLQSNPDIAFIATTNGLYKTTNALATASSVTWELVFAPTDENYWSGLTFGKGSATVLYASGKNVYRSTDQGDTWSTITGPGTGLDLSDATWSARPAVSRIHVEAARSSAYSNYLYALVNTGRNNSGAGSYPFRFDASTGTWEGSTTALSSGGATAPGWVPIGISPQDANGHLVYYGGLQIKRSPNHWQSPYTAIATTKVHDDVQALVFTPSGDELWAGTHGGVFRCQDAYATAITNAPWQARNSGLNVGLVYCNASSPTDRFGVLSGDQDNGLRRMDPGLGEPGTWRSLLIGDGSRVAYSSDGEHEYGVDYRNMTVYKWRDHSTTTNESTNLAAIGAWTGDPRRAIEPNENDGRMMFGYTDIWEETDPDATIGNMGSSGGHIRLTQYEFDNIDEYIVDCMRMQFTDAVIAPTNEAYIYLATPARAQNSDCPNGPYPSSLIRSIIPAQINMFGHYALEGVELPGAGISVTQIVVDPTDPERIWIACSGFEADQKVLCSNSRGDVGSWVNWDPNGTLPNLPVNDLIYQKGTDGGLYVAMDVGVYYRNNSSEDWTPYYETLPNVQVNDLDINYCAGKIRAGTYGRGLWESDLAERPTVEKVVSASVTWDFHRNLAQDLHVTNNATLTISSTVNFAPDTRLIIDPGAHVIVLDGGRLTNLCGEDWDRVEVRGNTSVDQVPLTDQGYLELRAGAVVEHVRNGVCLFGTDAEGDPDLATTGGVVRSIGTATNPVIFRDCKRGIWAKDYNFYQRSKVLYTNMESSLDGTIDHIRLEGLRNFPINHSSFTAVGFHDTPAPTGIRSFDSRFTVQDCSFANLTTGVRASDATLVKPCYVRNNSFDHCDRGITLNGVYNAEVTGNTFLIPASGGSWIPDPSMFYYPIPYGAYLYDCEGYEVEGNDFMGTSAHGNIGLLIRGSDQLPNEFALNTFKKLYVGSQVQGYNRSPDDGLKFRCNLYGNTDGTDGCVYDMALTTDDAAIAPVQGSVDDPAGNRFYPNCTTSGEETDIYVDHQSSSGFLYFHHEDEFTDPGCITSAVIPQATDYGFDESGPGTSCPDDPSHVISISAHKSAFHAATGPYVALKAVYDGEVNGGNTEDLVHMVADENIPSFTLRNALLAASPRLNDSVVIPAILRDPAMDEGHLVQVLLANSPLSADAGQAVKGSYVEELYTELWEQQQNHELRWTTLVEAELSLLRIGAERSRHDYFRGLLENDSTGIALMSMDEVVNDTVVPATPMEQIALLIAQADWTEADDRLADPNAYGLREDLAVVMTVVRLITEDVDVALATVNAAETPLRLIASDIRSQGHGVARNLLERFLSDSLLEPVILPGTERTMIASTTSKAGQQSRIEARPNPASTLVSVLLRGAPIGQGAYLNLADAKGMVVKRIPLIPFQSFVDLNVADMSSGLYRLSLSGINCEYPGVSLSIVH